MLALERQRLLLDHVRRHGLTEVGDLAGALSVSASTVRRDLAALHAAGDLRRIHGGAYIEAVEGNQSTPTRGEPDSPAKQRIGEQAAEHVSDGSTIMILAGSTTAAMLAFLAGKSITVVTNGLDVGSTLAAFPAISLVMLGGVLHREQRSLLGPITEQNMADLHVDTIFAGAYGIHANAGVTGSKILAAGYHHSMLRHTDALIVLADATKFGRRGPTRLATLEQVDTFITEKDASPAVLKQLRDRGAAIELA